MNQKIHVDIAPDGSLKIEAHGFTGSACRAATAPIEKVLGTVRSRTPKTDTKHVTRTNRIRTRLGGP